MDRRPLRADRRGLARVPLVRGPKLRHLDRTFQRALQSDQHPSLGPRRYRLSPLVVDHILHEEALPHVLLTQIDVV